MPHYRNCLNCLPASCFAKPLWADADTELRLE